MSRRRQHPRAAVRLVGALALLTCAALALVAPAAAAPVTFGSGSLDWGVKQSFREYITEGPAAGSYTASDGAVKLSEPKGVVRFDVLGGPYDDETGIGNLLIDGTVHFTGHSGSLDLTIKNIRLALVGASGTLHADVTDKDLQTGAMSRCLDVAFGDLGPITVPTEVVGDAGLTWASVPVALSPASAPFFAGFYDAGAVFDPLQPLVAEYGTPTPRPDRGDDGGEVNCDRGGNGGGGGGGGNTGGGGGGTGGGGISADPPKVSGVTKPVTLGAGRIAKIATLRCGVTRCTVSTPKAVKVKIKRKRYSVKVLAPRSLSAGGSGGLRVQLSKAARKALAGRQTTVKVAVALTADGKKTTKTIKATLKAKKAKAGAARRRHG